MRVETFPRHGFFSLQISRASVLSKQSLISVLPSKPYVLEAAVRGFPNSDYEIKGTMRIYWQNVDGQEVAKTIEEFTAKSSDWQLIRMGAKSPADATKAEIQFSFELDSQPAFIDDIAFVQTELPSSRVLAFDETIPFGEVDTTFGLKETFSYPNPAKNRVTIRVDTGLADQVTVRVFNDAGESLKEFDVTEPVVKEAKLLYEKSLPTADLPSGTYLFRVEARKGEEVQQKVGKMAVVK
jgi:hypothetical protein